MAHMQTVQRVTSSTRRCSVIVSLGVYKYNTLHLALKSVNKTYTGLLWRSRSGRRTCNIGTGWLRKPELAKESDGENGRNGDGMTGR